MWQVAWWQDQSPYNRGIALILKAVLYSVGLATIALLGFGTIMHYVGRDIINAALESMGD